MAIILATAAQTGALRVTETSITETGRVDGPRNFKMKTRGYGLGYVDASGFGGHITALTTSGRDEGAPATGYRDVELKHVSLDASYTHGLFEDLLLLTGGFGAGVSGKARFTDGGGAASTTSFASKDVFLGPGCALGAFEIYWIHRRNYLRYEPAGRSALTMSSRHYQLGLGWRF